MNKAELAKDFLFIYNDWFAKKYQKKQDGRFPTFKAALNLFLQRGGKTICETGCARQFEDFGAGLSSRLFAEVLKRYGGHLYSVDINPTNIATCAAIVADCQDVVTLVCSDSVLYLENLKEMGGPEKIDLLYLDSWDFDYGAILNYYGARQDYARAVEVSSTVPYDEIYERFKAVIDPCQDHCVKEFVAAQPYLHDKSVILIDDSNFPGRGKPGKLNDWLANNGYELVLDWQQSLWLKA